MEDKRIISVSSLVSDLIGLLFIIILLIGGLKLAPDVDKMIIEARRGDIRVASK